MTALLDRIDDIAPILVAGSREADTTGRLAASAIDALRSAGLFRFWWPAELGGVGASLTDGILTIERMAAVDTTAAWVLAVGSAHAGFAGAYLADDAVGRIFGDTEPVIAGQMAPVGRARPVEGGLRVTGSWSFGSGIHHANWVLGGATIVDDHGQRGETVVVVAPIEAALVDRESWQVAGLAGTGSCDYGMSDRFVPEGWWFSFPLARRRRGGTVFDLPTPVQAIILHGGFVLGTARRSLDEITLLATTRTRANLPSPLGAQPTFQRDLAQHHAHVEAARLYVYEAAGRLEDASGANVSGAALESRAAGRHATDVAIEVTTWAYRCGGGTALRLDHPLQQMLRDTLGAAQHLFVDEAAYISLGADLVSRAAEASGRSA